MTRERQIENDIVDLFTDQIIQMAQNINAVKNESQKNEIDFAEYLDDSLAGMIDIIGVYKNTFSEILKHKDDQAKVENLLIDFIEK